MTNPLLAPEPTSAVAPARLGDALPVLVGATIALLPLLIPAGPGNTSVADVGIVGSVLVAALWMSRDRLPVSLPYLPGVALMMIGGALAALLSRAPIAVVLVLAQDALLLLWAATLALGRHDPAIIRAAVVTWCRVCVVYSAVVVLAYLVGFGPLSGVTTADGARASYTFGDPNLAGNYLVTSLFMMAACQRPRAASTRRVGYLVVLVAIAFTGSNGAMLTLLVGVGLCVAISRFRRAGAMAGLRTLTAAAVLSAVVLLVVAPRIDVDTVRREAAGSIPLLRDSFGRSGSSTSERQTIFGEGVLLYLEGNGTGVGPARTKATLEASQAPYVKEAHNDYLAILLERGLIGGIGLLLLGLAVATRCWRLVTHDLSATLAAVVPRAWLLVVIAPVMMVAGGFYEVLHFRHLWAWLGIIAALTFTLPDEEREPS